MLDTTLVTPARYFKANISTPIELSSSHSNYDKKYKTEVQ